MMERPDLPEEILRLVDPDSLVPKTLGCSGALVFDTGTGFLKIAPKDSLRRAAVMQEYFARKGLSAPLLAFEQDDEHDFMLTAAMDGRDATAWMLSEEKLSARLGEAVRRLHETDAADCPLTDANGRALEAYQKDAGEPFADSTSLLKADTIIHGDCCLPNIFFDGERFAGFIDLGDSGLGDRHFDIYWVCWSLEYNLKTTRYTPRLLDAYGRDEIDEARLDLCRRISEIKS